MRKFMDLLNMDNWERYKEKSQTEQNQLPNAIYDRNTEPNEDIYEFSPTNETSTSDVDSVISEITDDIGSTPNVTPENIENNENLNAEVTSYPNTSDDVQLTIPGDLLHLNESISQEQITEAFNMPTEKKIIIPFTKKIYSFAPNCINYKLLTNYWNKIPYISWNQKTIPEASSDEKLFYCTIIMLYNMSDCAPSSIEQFDQDYYYCNVSNAHLIFEHLLNNGYFSEPTIAQILNNYRLAELKTILRSVGAKVSGNKPDLINRIITILPPNDIERILQTCDYLVVSEKGLQLLRDNFDYVELHRHFKWNISLYEYNQWRICGNKVRNFNDICFRVLSERVRQNLSDFYYAHMLLDYRSLVDIELDFSHPDIAAQDFIRYVYFISCDIHSIQWYCHKDHLCYECLEVEMLENKTFFPESLPLIFSKVQKFYSPQLASSIYCTPDYPPSLLTLHEFIEFFADLKRQIIFDKRKYEKSMAIKEFKLWNFNKQ